MTIATKPLVSVLCVTARLGGIDVLADGLLHQGFQDYELVLVDCLYPWRGEAVQEYLEFCLGKDKVKVIPPDPYKFPLDAIPSCRNTALRHASGDIILWWVDYTWAPPWCLEDHLRAVDAHGSSMGVHVYCVLPAIAPAFPSALTTPEYAAFVKTEMAQRFWISLSEDHGVWGKYGVWGKFGILKSYCPWKPGVDTSKEIKANAFGMYLPEPRVDEDPGIGKDPKRDLLQGYQLGDYFHAKNEAFPKPLQEKAGYFLEELDGGHCYDDLDMGQRLGAAAVGGKLWVDPNNKVYILNPRPFFPHLQWVRSVEDNFNLWHQIRGRQVPVERIEVD